MKLITTRVLAEGGGSAATDGDEVESPAARAEVRYHLLPPPTCGEGGGGRKQAQEGSFCVRCGDGSVLALLELQPVGKKVMKAKNFFNGLRGRTLSYVA